MATDRPVTLVILAWNRWDLTVKCLTSLRQTDLAGARVLVVDNGSSDETPRELEQRRTAEGWPDVLRLPANVGFVRGNNEGIQAAAADSDVVLLNNDLVFTQHDWLQRLRACAHASPDIGVVGCRMVLPNGLLLHAGTYVLPDTMWGQQIGALEKDVGQYTTDREVDGIVFACAYLRREVLDAVGGLALDFESYFEDTDYCLRAREAGFRVVVCGGVTLVHDEHGSTQRDSKRFQQLFAGSRETFRRKWGARLAARYRHHLLWQSILNFPTGYATSSRHLLRALDDAGVHTAYRYVYGPRTPFPVVEPEDSGDYRLNVLRERSVPRRPPVAVVYGQGDVFARNRGRYKIGYTMLEVDGFPAEWVRQANRMDEVWVPTEFNRDGFMASGLRRPIHVMPLGVDPAYFHPGITAYPNPHGEFVFLSVFEWGERKEPWLLLKAFSEVFTASEPVRLLCKVMNRDPEVRLREEIRRLGLRAAGGRISFLFNVELPHHQLGSLYRSADAFVTTGRGEGWDMPLLEAMASGLPAIATDWGAHREFFHPGVGYPLAIRGTVPAVAKCPYYAGFSWAEPDGDHLRHLLREVYEHQQEARALGVAAAAEVASRWSWERAAGRIAARLDAIVA
jgi:GT2 family glycosyltransferase